MSTPRTKRQFAGASADPTQRRITSFFNNQSGAEDQFIPASQPILPANVQSNLLSVGMRVRKSVPEGYKTVGTSAFKLWTDNTKPSSTATPTAMKTLSRELLPFCGINKVGGLESQPAFEYSEFDEVPALDEVPELTMSQESVDNSTPSRKRYYMENEDDASETMEFSESSSRILAVPRTRRGGREVAAMRLSSSGHVTSDNDFQDAGFLVYHEEEEEMDVAA